MTRFLFSAFAVVCAEGVFYSVANAQTGALTAQTRVESYKPAYAEQLERVKVLIRSNVLDLAQHILETQGPPIVANDQWANWERQLWALYEIREDWEALMARIAQIPPGFPNSIHYEADTKAISAAIELNNGAQARRLLRKHLFSTAISEREKKKLRYRIIESYLNDNLLPDATVAMQSYQHDYRSQEEQWLSLSARVYMQTGDFERAINLLAPLTDSASRLLRIQARLNNNSMSAEQAISSANSLLDGDQNQDEELDTLSVLISASERSRSSMSIIPLLERYLIGSSQTKPRVNNVYRAYSVSDLFDSYSRVALDEANRIGLLIDDHQQWLDYLDSVPANNNQAMKAMYAYVCLHATRVQTRKRAIDGYVSALIGSGGTDLILQTFGEGNVLGPLNLSADIGLRLSNYSLEQGNVHLAAAVSNGLTEIPVGMKQEDWVLHVARVSIIAGEYDKGSNRLRDWIVGHDRLTPEQTDKVLQPVFDLQTVSQHHLALSLLHLINDRSSSDRHRREISYWLAESYKDTKQYLKAADYFLFSAIQKSNGFDQWGESARFNAAESLVQANQVSDARVLFEDLLSRATQESRKNSLKQRLQQIRLLESYQPD